MEYADGNLKFKISPVYVEPEFNDYTTLTIQNGTLMEPENTYWIKRGNLVYVNISGIRTNDGTTNVFITGLPTPAYRVNACMFSNMSSHCVGIFSDAPNYPNNRFMTIPTGQVEQLYGHFIYIAAKE